MSFLKRGYAAQKVLAQEEARVEARANRVFRFWLKNDGEARITFVDGDLTEEGLLNVPMCYEHQLYMNGSWRNWFVCVGEEAVCPICEGGDSPSLVAPLTIINHTSYKDKQGKEYRDQVQLFIAKRKTIKLLQKLALKRGGLSGWTVDVSRTGDDAPNVGSIFDFVEKKTPEQLQNLYKVGGPLDYEKHLVYMEAEELRKLGFGSIPVGAVNAALGQAVHKAAAVDFEGEL